MNPDRWIYQTWKKCKYQHYVKKLLTEFCWSHGAESAEPVPLASGSLNQTLTNNCFWSFLTKIKRDQALQSHVDVMNNGKIYSIIHSFNFDNDFWLQHHSLSNFLDALASLDFKL